MIIIKHRWTARGLSFKVSSCRMMSDTDTETHHDMIRFQTQSEWRFYALSAFKGHLQGQNIVKILVVISLVVMTILLKFRLFNLTATRVNDDDDDNGKIRKKRQKIQTVTGMNLSLPISFSLFLSLSLCTRNTQRTSLPVNLNSDVYYKNMPDCTTKPYHTRFIV